MALIAQPKTIVLTEKEFEELVSVHSGYVKLKKYNDGSYGLSAQMRVLGGGPFFAKCVYWAVKIVAVSCIVTAVVVTAAATGGSVFAAVAPLLPKAIVGSLTAGEVGIVAGCVSANVAATATGAGALPMVAGGLGMGVAAVNAGASTLVTASLVSTYGSLPAVMAAVEGVATGSALVALAAPTP